MSRYIDADKILYEDLSEGRGVCWVTFMDWIKEMPTADVRKNVKGNWIKRVDHLDYGLIKFEGFECSSCGFRVWKNDYENIEFKFCPCCGADMRGE